MIRLRDCEFNSNLFSVPKKKENKHKNKAAKRNVVKL